MLIWAFKTGVNRERNKLSLLQTKVQQGLVDISNGVQLDDL